MRCDFPLFLAIWNASQGQSTPLVHLKIARWLNQQRGFCDPRLLLMAFRSCGKSTLVGVFCAWCLAGAPNTRILVLSADLALARKMVRNVKRIIEKHPMTKHLKPDKIDQWGGDKFTVNRDQELRDPSMLAKGITTNLTGTRADIIICDDVEVPKTSDTAEKRLDLRARLLELDYILTPNGMQLYVGTPHCWNSIYADTPRAELGEDQIFLEGFTRYVQPILTDDGQSVWPERYPRTRIDKILRKTGPAQFESQMMCRPVNHRDARLNPALLQFYEEDITKREAQGQWIHSLCGRKLLSVAGWWDPAFGKASGDRSVLAIVYTDEVGENWLHHLEAIYIDPHNPTDEATQQCEQIAKIAKQYELSLIAVETNGLGKFLPRILNRELGVAGAACAIREITSRKQKSARIMEAFDARLAAQAIHVHRNILKTPFVKEMEDWHQEKRGGHDDCLDAVAGALLTEPVRVGANRHAASQQRKWTAMKPTQTAKTDFDV